MSADVSLLQKCLNKVKSTVFEKGKLIYRAHIPALRRQKERIEASWSTRPDGDAIRVGFVLQVPQNWVVLGPLYEAALANERIEPVVLLVPELEIAHYISIKNVKWEEIYAFGEAKAPEHCVRTYDPKTGEWLDPATLSLDYAFIIRPYETYLPKQYRASGLSNYAKVCHITYACTMTDDDWPVEYNSHFMRCVSLIFADRPASVSYLNKQFHETISTGIQKVYSLGFPGFDGVESHRGNESAVWPRPRACSDLRIIWAPRWTIDPRMGGGHFFDYKDQMIELAERDQKVDLLFRPHPMALGHYVSQGWITQEEEDAYLARYERCANASVDLTREYYDTFFSSDVLITDFSSMVYGYLFTGKPLIYCGGTLDYLMNEEGLLDCMYIASSFDDILRYLEQFRRGEDPKLSQRMEIANRLNSGDGVAPQFMQVLLDDFDEGKKAEHASR